MCNACRALLQKIQFFTIKTTYKYLIKQCHTARILNQQIKYITAKLSTYKHISNLTDTYSKIQIS